MLPCRRPGGWRSLFQDPLNFQDNIPRHQLHALNRVWTSVVHFIESWQIDCLFIVI